MAAFLAGASLRADVPSEPTVTSTPKFDYSVSTSVDFSSEYVFRGVKDTNQAFQPSVEVDSNNFDIGVWTNQPILDNQQDEVDFYGGYKYAVNRNLSLQAVATYYWYPEFNRNLPTNHDGAKDSFEPGVGVTYTIGGFSPSVFYYYDTMLENQTVQGSVGYALPLAKLGTELDLTGYVGASGGRDVAPGLRPYVHQSYDYYGADVSLPYKLSSNSTLTIAGHYASNADEPAGTKQNLVWWSLALTMGF
ncbi:MAG: TorF family putative porin [Opitutaceae bacterium]